MVGRIPSPLVGIEFNMVGRRIHSPLVGMESDKVERRILLMERIEYCINVFGARGGLHKMFGRWGPAGDEKVYSNGS